MVVYRIEIDRSAAKALAGFDKGIRTRLIAAIDALAYNPRPSGVKNWWVV